MDVIDLTRQVQELTARVELLTRQRDDARTASASMQRELEALREQLAVAQRAQGRAQWLCEGNGGYADRMERAFAASQIELHKLRVAAEALVDAVEGHQRVPATTPRSSLEARLLAEAFAARDRALVALCDALGRPVSDSLRHHAPEDTTA